jgi:predicted dehydrogenase
LAAVNRPVRVAAVGLAHAHIVGQTEAMLAAGAELVAVQGDEPAQVVAYTRRFPQARAVAQPIEIFEDPAIDLVLCAAVPDQRAELAVQAMQHGQDVMIDKPAAVTRAQLDALRRMQQATGRIVSVWFSERLAVGAAARASVLIDSGAIGQVLHTTGLGPHRLGTTPRPPWFFQRASVGGILCDIGVHQIEQFLHYTGSTQAEVVAAQVANQGHPQHPELQDFGDALLRGNGGSGYLRVDWHTPAGLPTWGDGRLMILGTEGSIELRKNIDPAGRPGRDHLFLVDRQGVQYIDCSHEPLPYATQLLDDVRQRTETAMPQAHTFLALDLALRAQALAEASPGVLP